MPYPIIGTAFFSGAKDKTRENKNAESPVTQTIRGNTVKNHKNDIILIAVLLIFAAAAALIMSMSGKNGAVVRVNVDGALYGEYPLSQNAEILIENEGHENLLVIKDGEAYMQKASCKNQVCVNQGKISRAGQGIACLPNKVLVTIEGGKDPEVDAVAQ